VPVVCIVLDAPMGARMTDLYRAHPDTLRHARATPVRR